VVPDVVPEVVPDVVIPPIQDVVDVVEVVAVVPNTQLLTHGLVVEPEVVLTQGAVVATHKVVETHDVVLTQGAAAAFWATLAATAPRTIEPTTTDFLEILPSPV